MTSLIEDPPLVDQDEHPFMSKDDNPAASREDTGLFDGHDDDETEPGRSAAPGGNVFASMLNRGATALNKLASGKSGFGTLPDLADVTGDGNGDAKDKKPDRPAAGPGFGLPPGKRRRRAGDLIFGENNYLVFNLLTTDTVGSDLNVGAVSKPIFTTCVSEYLFAAGFGTCAAERPLSEQSKVSYAATHVFGGLLSIGGGVLVENHGQLCSGATAHSQATAYGTFCCLRYTDHRLVQKKGAISRASHMKSLNRILPQKLEKISLQSIPAGFKETATHGAKTMRIVCEDGSPIQQGDIADPMTWQVEDHDSTEGRMQFLTASELPACGAKYLGHRLYHLRPDGICPDTLYPWLRKRYL